MATKDLMRWTAVFALTACAASAPPPECPNAAVEGATVGGDDAAIGEVLDDWHAAAADADEERYFAHFTDDAVFVGTDATERWGVDEFREYSHPHFARGTAWTMRPTRRAIILRGALAWFDEDLQSEGLGPVRGSGVLRQVEGQWRIAHYVLSFTIPNERVRALQQMLAEEPEAEPADSTSNSGPTSVR